MAGIFVRGTGMYVPDIVVRNDDFLKFIDTSDEWISTRTGIKERRMSDGEPTWLMGQKAAVKALEDAEISAEDVDLIIHTSITPDYFYPSMASVLQDKLGAREIPAMDVNCACAGFVYAMDMARHYLAGGEYENILIVSAENLTKQVDFTDRSVCVLFGDGAGAVVVSKSEKDFYSCLGSDGSGGRSLFAIAPPPANAFSEPKDQRQFDGYHSYKEAHLYMDGKEVYKFATSAIPKSIREACKKGNIAPEDIKYIIPHQANLRIVETAAKRLRLPIDKFFTNIDRYGNTSSASVPIALDELHKSGKLKRGDLICLSGFGAGLSYGSVIFEW